MTDFPHVFEPLRLRHKTLRARINLGAHTTNMSEAGYPSERHIGYYRERALGGAGMIVVEPIPVHATGVLTRGNFRPDDDSVIPFFRALTDSCHEAAANDGGVVMIHQLYHVGQHGDADNSFEPNWSPSGLPSYHDADGSHAMTETEIAEVLGAYVRAAVRAKQSGFDGVELYAAYHALVDQFWTPWSNRRTDEWGGTFENRMRFSRTLLERIRNECGEDFIIGLATNVDTGSEASLTLDELCAVVAWHDQRELMDYVTCGTGGYFNFAALMPTSLYPARLGEPFAAALKKVVSHALVQCESHVRTPANAEDVLASGHADMVSIVRGQIADPHFVNKARGGVAEEIRPCISCNQLCWGRRSRDYWISCLVNPSTGREFQWGGDRLQQAAPAKKILVVGGGPAGMEAARVAAERGHQVTLMEARPELGGQWRLASRQPSRTQIGEHLDWYAHELDRLGVEVKLKSLATLSAIEAASADEIVLALGARPTRRGFQRSLATVETLPGFGSANTTTIEDVMSGEVRVEGRVLLVDDLGDWRGIGTALYLQEQGCSVALLTSAPAVALGLVHSAADIPLRQRFAKAGGEVLVSSTVHSFAHGVVEVRCVLTGNERSVLVDWLVAAETPTSNTELVTQLREQTIPVHLIGDAVAPRRASLAMFEGRRVAMGL
jgi:2,4-dienoyl-CoA reductase-like NADH-dependent reductase (Old Yellow Enzyme family)/thioredoxin reductase